MGSWFISIYFKRCVQRELNTFFRGTHKIYAGLFFASAMRQGLGTANKQPTSRFHVRNRPCAGNNEGGRQNK